MLKLSVKKLTEAIGQADAFSLPGMNAGTEYLYKNLYQRLANKEDVRLSEINFGAFEPDDIESLKNLYSETLEKNGCMANSIIHTLRSVSPVYKPVSFV